MPSSYKAYTSSNSAVIHGLLSSLRTNYRHPRESGDPVVIYDGLFWGLDSRFHGNDGLRCGNDDEYIWEIMKAKKGQRSWIEPSWPAPLSVRAFTTTRVGGLSQGPYRGLNLALHVGDNEGHVLANRAIVRAEALLPEEPLWLQQVHGTQVLNHTSQKYLPSTAPEADASVAFESGQVCAVLTADCLPLLLCDRLGTKVAAVHAGWRGLCAGVIEAAVQHLHDDPTNLMAWLGPAISQKHYEVGFDVYEAFKADEREQGFVKRGIGKWGCDLYALARLRLAAMGIRTIHGGDDCTYEDSQNFYSYRRSGVTGRMATLIWLEHP